MTADDSKPADPVKELLLTALSGLQSHVPVKQGLEGLAWSLAGEFPAGSPHSVFQIVNHLVYWQSIGRKYLSDENPELPAHAIDSWPGAVGPASEADWKTAVETFREGLEWFEQFVRDEDMTAPVGYWPRKGMLRMGVIQIVATHNSYHFGQIVSLRCAMGSWPPPGGGDTW